MTLGPLWVSAPYIQNTQISMDLGKTYAPTKQQILLGTYFFLSDERKELSRVAYNVLTLFSEIGGLFTITVNFFGLFMFVFNR